VVMMTLFGRDGRPKLVDRCTLPLTGLGCCSRIYTDLAVVDVGPQGAVLVQAFGTTHEELQERLGVTLHWSL
jgi:3-oxoadipate CoA-transferase beta subunit